MVATSSRPLVLRILFFLWLFRFTLCQDAVCPAIDNANTVAIPRDNDISKWLVKEHNVLRRKVAKGKFVGKGSEILPRHVKRKLGDLKWNDTLQELARTTAGICGTSDEYGQNSMFINETEYVKRFFPSFDALFSRNPTQRAINKDFNKDKFWRSVVTTWVKEGSEFRAEGVKPFAANPETDDFTQMIWEDSFDLGCGVAVFFSVSPEGPRVTLNAVCIYSVKGNIQGEPIYDTWTGIIMPDIPCLDSEYILDMSFKPNDTEKMEILARHNEVRNNVTKGIVFIKEKKKPVWPFKDLPSLTWDTTLAESAQNISDQCNHEYLMFPRKDQPENVYLFDAKDLFLKPYVGADEPGYAHFVGNYTEYIWRMVGANQAMDTSFWLAAIDAWIQKSRKLDIINVDPALKEPESNDFIQMIIPNTTKVGCGASLFRKKKMTQEYDPSDYRYQSFYDQLITLVKSTNGGVAEILDSNNDIASYTLAVVCRYDSKKPPPTEPPPVRKVNRLFSCPRVTPPKGFSTILHILITGYGRGHMNKIRRAVSKGTLELRNTATMPKREGLHPLHWDDNLRVMAEEFSSTCEYKLNDQNGHATISYHGLPSMRNFFPANNTIIRKWLASKNPVHRNEEIKDVFNYRHLWTHVIRFWEDEKNFVDPVSLKPKYSNVPTGNFTQMIAKNITVVGCGATVFISEAGTGWHTIQMNFVCDFDGEFLVKGTRNEPIYKYSTTVAANTSPTRTTISTATNGTTTFVRPIAKPTKTIKKRPRITTDNTDEPTVDYTDDSGPDKPDMDETEPDESSTPSPTGDTTYQPSSVTFKRRPLKRRKKCGKSGSAQLQRFSVQPFLAVCSIAYIAYRNLGMS